MCIRKKLEFMVRESCAHQNNMRFILKNAFGTKRCSQRKRMGMINIVVPRPTCCIMLHVIHHFVVKKENSRRSHDFVINRMENCRKIFIYAVIRN